MSEIFIEGGKAVRAVYEAQPAMPILVTTSGMSPCTGCPTLEGLGFDEDGDALKGGAAANSYLNFLMQNSELMNLVDGVNINVTDHNGGYGFMDPAYFPHTWGGYDLLRSKLDNYGHGTKTILSAESWISWADAGNSNLTPDINGDGIVNEADAYEKAITIMGRTLERGLNTVNFPWRNNSSAWSMGLTKQRDYDGSYEQLDPTIVSPATDGGSKIVVRKNAGIRTDENDNDYVDEDVARPFDITDHANPNDANQLHYYIWKWYSQISSGSDEAIRHAIKGELNNDIE